jgi:hypothetical protein
VPGAYPDDTNPTSRNTSDEGETPVTESGDDGRDQLGETEGQEQGDRGTLHEEESVRSGDKDQGLRDDGDLEVDDHVHLTSVGVLVTLDAKLVLEEGGVVDDDEEDDGRQGQVETVSDTVGENLGQVPRVRGARRQDSVQRQGHDGTVVQDGDDQDHEGGEVELPDESHQGKADDDSDGDGTGVDGIVPHTLENDSGSSDSVNDGRETGLGQDNVGGTSSSVGGTLDGDTDVGTRKSGGVVGTVTSHGAQVSEGLDTLDNLKLVLGEDTGETVGVHDHLVQVGVLASGDGSVLQNLGGVHVVTETESTTGLLGNSELVTGNHLDLDTESHGVVDGLLGVGSGRVKDGQETDEFETVTLGVRGVTEDVLESDSEGSETSSGKLFDVVLELVLDLGSLVSGAEFDDDTGHTLGGTLELAGRLLEVGDLGPLVDGVEGLEVQELDSLSGEGRVREGSNDTSIDGVLVLGTGRVGGEQDTLLDRVGTVGLDVLLVDGQLVGGQGTGLVGTQDGDTGQLLDGSDTGDNGLVLGELLGTDGQGDGQHGRHGDGDTTNEQDQDVVETVTVRVSEVGVEDEDLQEDEETDRNETEGTDPGEDHLQVTGLVVVGTDEGGGTTEEGVGTGRDDDTLGLSLLAGRSREALVTELLSLGQRFTSKSGLVHAAERGDEESVDRHHDKCPDRGNSRNVNGLDQSTIRGADISVLESDQITGNQLGGL